MKYIIANFKSNKNSSEISAWIDTFHQEVRLAPFKDCCIIVAPPHPYYYLFHTDLDLKLAGQDVSPFPPGSYTGAISAKHLSDNKVEYCIIGHSERRRYFEESCSVISRKADELISNGITPVICLSQEDIAPQFASLDENVIAKSLFAFEVASDIGGQETTPISDIKNVVSTIKDYTKSASLGILYGGSVNEKNASSLTNIVDGLLIATASQDATQFATTIRRFTSHV